MKQKGYMKLRKRILRIVPKNKLAHTMGVEKLAIEYARRLGIDEYKASIVALMHDVTKNMTESRSLDYIKKYSGEDVKTKNESLHALTASIKARVDLDIKDKAIINSIRYHSIPRARMSKLDKAIYLADWLEPGRSGLEIDTMRRIADFSIDEAIMFALDLEIVDSVNRTKRINTRFVTTRNNLLKECEAETKKHKK